MKFPVYDIKQFSYFKYSKTFATEASTLGIPAGVRYPTEFTIKNFETGNKVAFRWAYEKCDEEGELLYSVYFRSDAQTFDAVMYQVHIFND